MRTTMLATMCAIGAVSSFMPVAAQAQAGGPSAELEEILVTARRREENIQVVPVAITAFSDEALRARRIESLEDLQHFVPSLSTYSAHRDAAIYSIRGQGGFAPGGTASVVAYANEVPSTASGPGLYYDLQSLQVLKGPQGTLFGRNTTGGAILFQSKRPTEDLEGHVQGTLGNYKDREIEAVLNVPVVAGKALLRVAGTRQVRGGVTRNTGMPGRPNGLDLDNRDLWAGRVSVTLKPSEDFKTDIIADYFYSNNHNTAYILSAVNPALSVPLLFPSIFQLLAQQQALGARTQIPLANDTFLKTERWGITDISEWTISETLTFRNIIAWRYEGFQRNSDNDGTALRIFELGNHFGPLKTHQFTEEPQLQAKLFDSRLTAVVGAFYLRTPKEDFSTEDRFTFNRPIRFSQQVAERTKSLYAQGTYDLARVATGLRFTAGFRYTWDERYAASRSLTAGACTSVGADALCTLQGSGKFRGATWTFGLDYQVTPGSMVYVQTRRGYRSGGFNVQSRDVSQRKFQPEYVTDVELGLKSDWTIGGMAGRTNVATYLQKYTNIQLNNAVVQQGTPASLTQNIAKASIFGAEFEGQLKPTKDLDLTVAYAWGFPNFDRFDPSTAPSVAANYRWSNFPRHKVTVGFTYHLPLDEKIGAISVGANLAYQGQLWLSTTRDPFDSQDAYSTLNATANWNDIVGYPVDLSFFINNATNRLIKAGSFSLYNTLGLTTVLYAEPRMYGVRLRYRFGAEG